MIKNKYYISLIFLICFALNILTECMKTFSSFPSIIYSNIVGTTLAAITLGPIYGSLVGGLSSLSLSTIGIGNSSFSIFFIVNIFEGFLIGIIAFKNKYSIKAALLTSIFLTLTIPFIGILISSYLFNSIPSSGFIYMYNLIVKSAHSYILFLNKNFITTFFKYISSYIISLIILKTFSRNTVIYKKSNNS